MGRRETWPDVLRGIAVLFVVAVHIRFFASASLGGQPDWALTFNSFMAPFYLPALFFIAGYFVPLSMRRGPRAFAWNKVLMIGWPLLLWNVVNTARGSDITDIGALTTISYLWFLLYLLGYNLVAALAAWSRIPGWLLFAVAMLAAVYVDGPSWLGRSLSFAPYFFAGIAVSPLRTYIGSWARSPLAGVAVLAGLGACYYSALPGSVTAPLIQVLSLLAIAAGIVLAVHLSSATASRPFVWLGQNSLEIYVLHWQIGLLIAPLWPHWSSEWLGFAVIGTVVLALSCFAAWLFTLPVLRLTFNIKPVLDRVTSR